MLASFGMKTAFERKLYARTCSSFLHSRQESYVTQILRNLHCPEGANSGDGRDHFLEGVTRGPAGLSRGQKRTRSVKKARRNRTLVENVQHVYLL